MTFNSLAISDCGFADYIRRINVFPILTAEEEYKLAKQWVDGHNMTAAHALVKSHLRLVVKVAMDFKSYGLALMDLISEGTIGLMQAVKKFDPDRGFRLSTYAIWWIRAYIQDFVVKFSSMVKSNTTRASRKLFFNLRKLKQRFLQDSTASMDDETAGKIAEELSVSKEEVYSADFYLSTKECSLNDPIGDNAVLGDIVSDSHDAVEKFENNDELRYKRLLLKNAMQQLNERERDILISRRLSEKPKTLNFLSDKYKVSRERIRQIESQVLKKIKSFIAKHDEALV